MPKIEIAGPYKFRFFSNEHREPAHVHVGRERSSAKFWLVPVSIASNKGFAAHELLRIVRLIEANRQTLIAAWEDYEKRKY